MGKIKILDKKIVEKIAAGEVVERPASIVKELVENSIDAGSKAISIEIKNAGIDLIKIDDDGSGIEKEDLPLTIQLHATSKLHSIDELESIGSLGFRGEALASIAAVSELEIISSTSGGDAHKISNNSKSSKTTSQLINSTSRSKGTTIKIKNLFGKIPARRKFLKSERTEERVIRDLLKQFFINFPKINFKYILDDKIVYDLTPSDPKERITELFNFAKEDLIEIQPTEDSQIKISGILIHPKKAKKQSTQYTYVNGRSVKSSLISSAVKKAYADKMPPNLYPCFFINIDLPRSELDVNIHPRKEEVRFSNEKQVFVSVLNQVKETLNKHLRKDFEEKFDKKSTFKTNQFKTNSKPSHNYVKTSIDFSQRLLKDENIQPKKYSNNTKHVSKDSNISKPTDSRIIQSEAAYQMPSYNFLQVFNTFIIIEKEDKLLIIDQHAADERINFEKIKKKLTEGKIESTPLLIGEVVEIEKDLLGGVEVEKLIEGFDKLGFEVKKFGDSTNTDKIQLKIEAIPITLSKKSNVKEIVENIIIDFEKEDIDFSEIEKKIDLVCATMSCHSSIRGGDQLSSSEIRKLLDDLWDSESPYTCPHGRPVFYEISKTEMEKNFLRIQ